MPSQTLPVSKFRRLGGSPLLLLILSGTLVGSMLPMSRIATGAGWTPLAFAFWPALGSGLILLIWGFLDGVPLPLSGPVLRYSFLAGALSVAIPNSVTFFVMQELGTSLTSLMYTLAPLFTYAFAWMLGIERYRALRLAGIVLGLTGAVLLALGRPSGPSGSAWWVLLALCAPVCLAWGNIYRKQRMPRGVPPSVMAGSMLLAAALALLPLGIATGALMPAAGGKTVLGSAGVILTQCLLTTGAYLAYFRFQQVADAVYFSQIGYVISATGVFSGLLLFNEPLTGMMMIAIAAIVGGVAMVNGRTR